MNAIVPVQTGLIPSSPPAAPYLRQVEQSPAWLAAGRRDRDLLPLVTRADREILPSALANADALLAPTEPEKIVAALAPALTLVAPSGMSEDDREEWFAAAAAALRGIPGDLLYRGIRVAQANCDHPSKVVPAIIASVSAAWAQRRADRSSVRWLMDNADGAPRTADDICSPEQAKEILSEHGLRSHQPSTQEPAARREATIGDYLALGLSEQEAAQAMAERERLLGRSPAKPFASAVSEAISEAAKAA